MPFGDLDFVKYVMAIDPEKKLNTYGMGKYLLRKAFEGDLACPRASSGGRRRPSATPWATRWWTT